MSSVQRSDRKAVSEKAHDTQAIRIESIDASVRLEDRIDGNQFNRSINAKLSRRS
jgi:hypothetical protein